MTPDTAAAAATPPAVTAVAAAVATARAAAGPARCSRRPAPPVARRPRCRSARPTASRSTARTASAPSAAAELQRHSDERRAAVSAARFSISGEQTVGRHTGPRTRRGVGSVAMLDHLTRRRGSGPAVPPVTTSGDHLTDGRRLLQRLRSRRPRRGDRRLRRGLPRPPSSASRSPSWTRTRSAAPASTAAASPPRRSSSPPRSTSASGTRGDFGIGLPGDADVDYAQIAERRDQVVNRMWKGLQAPRQEERGDLDPGPRPPRGRDQGPRPASRGEDGTPGAGGERVLKATDVILATGSRVKSLPGHRPGREADRHLGRRPAAGRRCRPASSSIGAGAVGVEFASHVPRPRRAR